MMKVSLIVAMDRNRGIGKNNDLMWHLPKDMNFFKTSTQNQIVVMGRKNYDSIPEKYRPLPNRENVILTRNTDFKAEGCAVFYSLRDALKAYKNQTDKVVFIIGGGEIYKLAIEQGLVDEMLITYVNGDYDADTFFPEFDESRWSKESVLSHDVDDKHKHSFEVFRYKSLK
ncbi:MAG: dihydrofolate reductase [Crocinitomicaceae bacterium]|tara:strand:+ start:549 stop:1061 length:513 start_codon:yes stop_codon:yes gene_type:complete